MMPKVLDVQLSSQQQAQDVTGDDVLTQDIEAEDEEAVIDAGLGMSVWASIKNLRIPSTQRAKTIRVVTNRPFHCARGWSLHVHPDVSRGCN